VKHFSDDAVRSALHWDELIDVMKGALSDFSSGRVIQPLRTWLPVEDGNCFMGVMPVATRDAMGVKLVSLYPRNAGGSTPTVMATVLLMRPDTGEPIAVLEGTVLTAMRTAAVSAAVTDQLAAADSRVLALLGSGVEARSHLQALSRVRKFDEVRVWSRTRRNADKFAAEHGARAMDAEAAVRGADVIVTATPAREPILRGAWLKPGAHVNAIGAPMPTWRELDDEAMGNVVVVESREAASHESGDIILSHASIYAEVGEIFAGSKAARVSDTTVYKSVGLAVEDIAAAKLVFDVHSGKVRLDARAAERHPKEDSR
jgi:ornithine cyclodeaminase/alanine dehydrogenase-like protein (mu-crystallin family)